jgi:hypothetical protein
MSYRGGLIFRGADVGNDADVMMMIIGPTLTNRNAYK